MSRQTSYTTTQSRIRERVAVRPAPCLFDVKRKMALSFLALLTIMLFSGMLFSGHAHATKNADPSFLISEKAMPLVQLVPSIRLAQASSSMENWQRRAFTSIELQKRLDNLARDKKKRINRNRRIQRAALKQQKMSEVRQKKALTRERHRNKIRLRRSIQQAAKRRARKRARNLNRSRVASARNEARRAKVVTEPVKIQRCLKKAGYFNGVVTGRLDDATLLAFLTFRDDKNLQSRPNDLYDPESQKVLFSLCPDRHLNSLNQLVANSLLGRKPVFVTSVRTPEVKTEPEKTVGFYRGGPANK